MHNIADQLKNKKLIAIEGEPASGKTTLANYLKTELDCNVVSIDDFYLPLNKRNEFTFKKGGNNIDYERIIKEIILKQRQKKDIQYQVYDCRVNEYTELKILKYKPILILEGSYSLKEEIYNYFDYRILITVDSKVQLERVMKRPNYQDFLDRWIPLSRNFLKEKKVHQKVEFILNEIDF